MGFFLIPLVIYLSITYCKRKRSARKNSQEEDGMELTEGVTDRNRGLQPDTQLPEDSASNIGLAINTSEETFTLTKEQTRDLSIGFNPERTPPPAYQSSVRSVSRGRKLSRCGPSTRSTTRSLSLGIIRTAMIGQSLQDPKVIDVPRSLASSRKNSERTCSSSDADRSSDFNPDGDGERPSSENQGHGCVDKDIEDVDEHEGKARPLRLFIRRSSAQVSK